MKVNSMLWIRLWLAAYAAGQAVRRAELRARAEGYNDFGVAEAAIPAVLDAWRAELGPQKGLMEPRLWAIGQCLADHGQALAAGPRFGSGARPEMRRATFWWLVDVMTEGYTSV